MSTHTYQLANLAHYGLPIWVDGETCIEYAIAINKDSWSKALEEAVPASLWSLEPNFVVDYLELSGELSYAKRKAMVDLLRYYQHAGSVDYNSLVSALIGNNMCKLIEDAVSKYGSGYFLDSRDNSVRDFSELSDQLLDQLCSRYGLSDDDLEFISVYQVD